MFDDEIRKAIPPRKTLRSKSNEAIADIQKKDLTLQKCFDRLVRTEDGLFALQHIFKESTFNSSGLIMNGFRDVSSNMLVAQQGRAGLWADLRKCFSRESLIAIEYPQTKGQ